MISKRSNRGAFSCTGNHSQFLPITRWEQGRRRDRDRDREIIGYSYVKGAYKLGFCVNKHSDMHNLSFKKHFKIL